MKLIARMFVEFLDGMRVGEQFTLADFQDYVKLHNPRICPSNNEVGYLVKNTPNVGRIEKVGRWVTYEVLA